ncbi:redox-sensitive bicupin YhaK (pirin superfamily) [Pontibacter aydingkolensis]|uniref:Pirin family protein n=1 Tax=Pontibacter aydingkolensis TaxID=1911536 RepID=A0ABS7CXM2_9BACT|nr:pirin-like bicupin family protein [Pontibacter aydingkolensis]MBW7468594.1 pirin family protein [Pontibacter aydingkolensis]
MIKLITAAERHTANVGDWLSSHYLFSFADYYNPANVQFGPLKVFNDDVMKGGSSLPDHPHAEMEVVTVMLDGELTHRDSLGNETKLKAGEVQRMSAGTGLTHSETNEGEVSAHFYQLWFLPNKKGVSPAYEQMAIDFLDNDGRLTPLVTGQRVLENVLYMNSNSTVYFGKLGQGKDIDFKTFKIRKTLIYIIKGNMLVNNVEADQHDQVRLEDYDFVSIHAVSDAEFLLIDVPALEVNY